MSELAGDADSRHDEEHPHQHGGGPAAFVRNLVRPHSHDANDSIDDALAGSSEGIRAVKISLLGLGLTAVLQLAIVVVSGSIALLADTIHNFGDAVTAIPLWVAFALSRRAPTRHYTYGYGRAEDLAGVFVVLMIAASAGLAAFESITRLLEPQPIHHLAWVAAAGLIGLIGNEAVAEYRIRAGNRIGSAALVADGYHARTDGFTSAAVLLGAGGVALGFERADPLVGLVITIAILFVLKGAVVQIWRRVMDATEPGILERAEAAARGVEGVVDVSSVRPRWIGHELHAEARVTVNRELTVAGGHELAERVEQAMIAAVPKLASVIVHVNPCEHEEAHAHPTPAR